MATTVVNSTPASSSDNGMGFLLGVLLFIVFIGILLYFGLPYIQRISGGTQVNIPDHVNVNVKSSK